jgi:hypothetical protein
MSFAGPRPPRRKSPTVYSVTAEELAVDIARGAGLALADRYPGLLEDEYRFPRRITRQQAGEWYRLGIRTVRDLPARVRNEVEWLLYRILQDLLEEIEKRDLPEGQKHLIRYQEVEAETGDDCGWCGRVFERGETAVCKDYRAPVYCNLDHALKGVHPESKRGRFLGSKSFLGGFKQEAGPAEELGVLPEELPAGNRRRN